MDSGLRFSINTVKSLKVYRSFLQKSPLGWCCSVGQGLFLGVLSIHPAIATTQPGDLPAAQSHLPHAGSAQALWLTPELASQELKSPLTVVSAPAWSAAPLKVANLDQPLPEPLLMAEFSQAPTVELENPSPQEDPELGNLRLQERLEKSPPNSSPAAPLPIAPPENSNSTSTAQPDPELGELRLQETPQTVTQTDTSTGDDSSGDPELGDLNLRPLEEASPFDPELGNLRLEEEQEVVDASQLDPELGNLRLREQEVQRARSQPVVFLQGRVDYFQSDNIFSGVDPIDDGLVRSGLTLFAVPSLGPRTYFIPSINGNFIRYNSQEEFDYDELRFGATLYHQFTPRMYGEVGWANQQLFTAQGGDRFLDDHSIRLGLGRKDKLANALTLETFYQFRVSFAEPETRSRLINSLGASLVYQPLSDLEAAIDYQFVLSDFTQQDRLDEYHQLLARLSYAMTRNTRLVVFGGFSFGDSTNDSIDFDSSIFGVGLSVNLPLF